MAQTYVFLLLLAIVTNLFLIVKLSLRKEKSFAQASFIVFLFLILLWAVPQFLINYFQIENYYFTQLDRIAAIGYTFIPVVFVLFAFAFAEKATLLRRLFVISVMFLPAFIFLFLSWTTSFIEDHNFHSIVNSSWGISSPPGPFFTLFLAWFELLMIGSLFIIGSVYFSSGKKKKKQTLWLLLATIIPLSVGTVTDGILPIIGIEVFPMGIPLTTVTAIIIAYAISEFDLFEVTTQNIVSSLGEGVVSVDNDGRVIFINESAENLLRLRRREIMGENVADIVKLTDKNGREVPYEKRPTTLAGKSNFTKTFRDYMVSTKNRKKFAAGITVSTMVINNKIMGATLNFRDITEEKMQEKNTAEFISIASHELRTPVTVLKLATQMLNRKVKKENSEYGSSVSKIDKQTDRLVNLVGDLLNVSRLEAGKFTYNMEPVNLSLLLRDSIRLVRPSLKGRKIIYKKGSDEIVNVDKNRISQVVINLLVNADKYSSKDEKVIVGTRHSRKQILVYVEDGGPGIPKSRKRKIFEKYVQDNSKSSKSGLGIGLYISSQIIKDHGGKIWVEDNRGKGSKFIFSLPSYTQK